MEFTIYQTFKESCHNFRNSRLLNGLGALVLHEWNRSGYPKNLISSLELLLSRSKYLSVAPTNRTSKIKVLFDATRLITNPNHSGVSKTTYLIYSQLVNNFSDIIDVEACYNKSYLPNGMVLGKISTINIYGNLIEVRCLSTLDINEYDLYHSNYFPVPNFSADSTIKSIITIHDIIHLTHPEFYPNPEKFVTRDIVNCIKHVDLVLSISKYTSKSLNKLTGNNGINLWPIYWPPMISSLECSPYVPNDGKNYICFAYQNNDPRKNVDRMLEILLLWIKNDNSNAGIIYGNIRGFEEKIDKKLLDAGKIELINNPDDASLSQIFSRSSIHLYLSSAEGYGLPPLEAMSFGCPSIMFDNTSLGQLYRGWEGLLGSEASNEEILELATHLSSDTRYREIAINFAKPFSIDAMMCSVIGAYYYITTRTL